jgi:hypothetical protein
MDGWMPWMWMAGWMVANGMNRQQPHGWHFYFFTLHHIIITFALLAQPP